MFNLHMLCKGVFYLGICTYTMSHLNTSITSMFNLHMLCREVLDLHTCHASYLDTSITGILNLHMPGLHGQDQNRMKIQPWMAAVAAKQGENQC
jgi:hypothetical protein